MEFIAFIVTVLVGFVAESLLGNWLNWPGVGAVFRRCGSGGVHSFGRCGAKKRLPKHKAMPNPRAVAPAVRKNDFGAGEAEKRMSRFWRARCAPLRPIARGAAAGRGNPYQTEHE